MEKTLELILDLIIYQISGMEFCADAKKVIAILRPEELPNLPVIEISKPAPVIIRDNKEFLVVDIENYLDVKSETSSSESRLILLELNGERLIFFVDKVIEIISIDPNTVSYTAQYLNTVTEKFVDGMIAYEGRKFILPNYREICAQAKQNIKGKNGTKHN